jgi:Ca-activated chloride channel homolog
MTTLHIRAGFSLAAATAWLALVESASPQVRITSPSDGAMLTGAVTLRAEIDPPAAMTKAVFFVDGREACVVVKTPIECAWDAGPAIDAHQVRAAVTLAGGGRLVDTVHTIGLGYAEKVDVNLVQVSVTVTDDRGAYVRGLPRSAFHISEDGRPQSVAHFYAEDAPLEIVIALDISSSMQEAMPTMKKAVARLLAAIPPGHQVTILGFNDEVFTIAPRVADLSERAKVVDKLFAWGSTALYESLLEGVGILGAKPGRKAMLVFSDGEDRGSRATLEEVEETLQSNDLALYMIGQGQGLARDPLKKLMNRLAHPTGGRAIATNKIDELQDSFTELLEEMSNQYVLAYEPAVRARDGRWHDIKVTVDGHDRVRARQGYRARVS